MKKLNPIQQQKMLEVAIGSLRATEDECSSLCEILFVEGFGGREDRVQNEEQAREVAEERLEWFRQQRREEQERLQVTHCGECGEEYTRSDYAAYVEHLHGTREPVSREDFKKGYTLAPYAR